MDAHAKVIVTASFIGALFCACPFAVFSAPNEASTPPAADRQEAATPQGQQALEGKGCSGGSLAVLNDIIGSVSEDPFHSNPSIGGGSSTDPAGCGRPNRTRKSDPGNPVTPIGRPTSSFTIRGDFR